MKNIPIPKHLEANLRWRGLPVPYIALIKPDGQPDFRVTDEMARRQVIVNRKCQLCAEPLGKYIFFVGGPEAAKANQYYEPAAHLDCLLYAMQVCPFIVGHKEHVDPEKIQSQMPEGITIHVSQAFTVVRNPYWVIKKATGYDLLILTAKDVLIQPNGIIYETDPLHAESMTAEDWKKVEQQLKEANGRAKP
jgi:hypothetical protein